MEFGGAGVVQGAGVEDVGGEEGDVAGYAGGEGVGEVQGEQAGEDGVSC